MPSNKTVSPSRQSYASFGKISSYSSAPRVGHDPLGNDGLQQLFEHYKTLPDAEQFKQKCIEMIDQGTGSKEVKISCQQSIRHGSKDKALKTTTNFIMAGLGLKT